MKRLFLALDISPEQKSQIALWRKNHCQLEYRTIPEKNFHLTLCFIGNLESAEESKLIEIVDKLYAQKNNMFICNSRIEIANIGLFKKPKVLYLGPETVPEWLYQLQAKLSQALAEIGYREHHENYQPHISIYRKATDIPKIKPLKVNLKTKSFSLYHSQSTEQGVNYQPVKTWNFN